MVNVDRVSLPLSLSISLSFRPRAPTSLPLSSTAASRATRSRIHNYRTLLPTAGIKDDTRVFFLPLTIIMDWTERFEIERFQREERRRLAAEKLHGAWKIVLEKLPQRALFNPQTDFWINIYLAQLVD